MIAEHESTSRTSGHGPQMSIGGHALTDFHPVAPPELNRQPPAAPAATEVAFVHLVRWAPHPSADTAPGTEPSPRTPALVTVPPRQKLVEEASMVKAATPAADSSSLPVAELSAGGRRIP